MRKTPLLYSLCIALLATVVWATPIEVYFGPDGGFSPTNKNRTLTLPDGTVVEATINNSLLNMIERTERYGEIKICMYAMGHMQTLDALISAARDRRIKVKLLLDACAEWTEDIRKQIISRVKKAREECMEKKWRFDFQIKLVTREMMEDRWRTRTLDDGTVIYGTMHEKFGVFYGKDAKIPYDCFAGSSNVSYGASQIFAENRIFFYNRPAVARQFQEEFARVWNEYGVPVRGLGRCQSEMYVPAYPMPGDVRVIFNSEPITEDTYYRIDEEIEKLIRQVHWSEKGSVDVAMFSFTHRDLADALIRYAERRPRAKFRLLLDQTMLENTETHRGVLGPWFEQQVREKNLKNFEIRYKWRSNAYGWDEEEKTVHLMHTRNLLLHHKLIIVNKELMATGSYNWSSSAERRNLENIMIFKRDYNNHDHVIDSFAAEYNAIWDSLKPEETTKEPTVYRPQTIDGERGRRLQEEIIALLSDPVNLKLVESLDYQKFATQEQLQELAGKEVTDLVERLARLVGTTVLCKHTKEGVEGYSQAD